MFPTPAGGNEFVRDLKERDRLCRYSFEYLLLIKATVLIE